MIKLRLSLHELRADWRMLLRARRLTFKLGVIATLAIAIGANIAVLGNLGVLFGQVIPGARHQNIYQAYFSSSSLGRAVGQLGNLGVPPPFYARFAKAVAARAVTTLYEPGSGDLRNESGSAPEQLNYLTVTPSFLQVIGVQPVAGRDFDRSDVEAGAAPVIMISARVARARFGSASAAIGKLVTLAGTTRRVIAVLPDALVFPAVSPAAAWIPFPPLPAAPPMQVYLDFNAETLVRMNGTPDQAAIASALQDALIETLPSVPKGASGMLSQQRLSAQVSTLAQQEFAGVRAPLQLLEFAAAILLILICANLMGLAISDALARRHEFATCVALGAPPLRLYTERLRELLPLTLAGWAIGVALGWAGSRALKTVVGQAGTPMALSLTVLLVTLGAACAVALLLALAGTRRARGSGHMLTDLSSGPRASSSRKVTAELRLLVVVQLVASLALLLTTANLQANVYNLRHENLGFTVEHRTFITISRDNGAQSRSNPTSMQLAEGAKKTAAFNRKLIDRLEATPGIASVASLSSAPPLGHGTMLGISPSQTGKSQFLIVQEVSRDIVPALGLHTLAGDPAAAFLSQGDAVFIDSAAALRLWPHASPASDVGKTLYTGNAGTGKARVSAVVSALKMLPYHSPTGTVFVSPELLQLGIAMNLFVVQSALPRALLRSTVATQLAKLDPNARLTSFSPATQVVGQAYAARRHLTQVFATVTLVTILITAVGLFALLTYRTLVRRPEFAIRGALGATPARLFRSVALEAGLLWLVGCVIGIPLAYVLSAQLATHLPKLGVLASWLAALMAVALGIAAMTAALLPALCASRTELAQNLKP